MCFSATASFAAGAALTAVGVVTVKMSPNRRMLPFAAIPLMFGIQQIAEGFLWQSLGGCYPANWVRPSASVFLVFAQMIWPVWVAFSMMLIEESAIRRRILKLIMLAGTALAAYHLYCFFHYPIAVDISQHHIDYGREFPHRPTALINATYIVATLLPAFISSLKGMRLLGVMVFLSFTVTLLFYRHWLISVWCLFAAVTSVLVLYVVWEAKRNAQPAAQLR